MNEIDSEKDIVEGLIVLCLRKLVELGRVAPEQVNGNWYIEFNKEKLQSNGLARAATLDKKNQPVIYLLPNLNPKVLMFTVTHEVIHLMQICKGDLIPISGYMIWKGQEYKSLFYNHPEYLTAQPWEKEATDLQPLLLEYLKSKMTSLDS